MTGYLLLAALGVLLAVAFALSLLWQSSRRLALAIAIVLPVAAIGVFLWRTSPRADEAAPVAAAAAPAASATTSPADTAPVEAAPARSDHDEVDKLVADLEKKLAADPTHWEDWALLGRVRLKQAQYPAARAAFARAHDLAPDNDIVAVGLAEALMRTDPNHRFPPDAVALLERAAASQPPDERAVFFLGMQRRVSGRPAEAADLWESLLPRVRPDAALALRRQIAAARAAAGQSGAAPPPPTSPGATLKLTVAMGAGYSDHEQVGAIVFVVASPTAGGPPVAARRVVADRWPLAVTLSDFDRTAAGKLSDQAEVVVTARLSGTGNTTAAPGDLESAPTPVGVVDGATATLLLDRLRP